MKFTRHKRPRGYTQVFEAEGSYRTIDSASHLDDFQVNIAEPEERLTFQPDASSKHYLKLCLKLLLEFLKIKIKYIFFWINMTTSL